MKTPITLFILIVLLVLMTWSCFGAEQLPLSEKFVAAIHKVETGGRKGPTRGLAGELGPLQIRPIYWRDSKVSGTFSQCSEYGYSVKVMTAYLNKYAREAIANRNYEKLARIHNGGPNGHNKSSTKAYWLKVKKAMGS